MIIYFADRQMRILGNASTHLPAGLRVVDDKKIEDVESGIASFECYLPYTKETRAALERCAETGNYILRNHKDTTDFFTIIEMEINTRNQEIYIYAEDAGLDLLNEVVGAYEADKAYSISHYINKFAYDAGFKIKTNEVEGLTRQLSWDTEETATARIASVAAEFNNCEIAYSFEIKGLKIVNKYINIYENRGSNSGVQLRLNRDIDKIVTTKSIANVATALHCEGGTPDNAEDPITLSGYKYDDGDFFVSGKRLYSRKAIEKWGRYVWEDEPNQILGDCGHIVKQFSDDATNQATLCQRAIAELKKLREVELNFEVDISKLPDNVKIGDRVNIIDEAGELYLSTRILKLEESVAKQTYAATLGEYLIKNDGIAQSVKNLAAEFAKQTVSVKRAQQIANTAKETAESAKVQAETAATEAESAQTIAGEAQSAANTATQSAANAQAQAQAAQAAVDKVEESVSGLEKTVTEAKTAADNAQLAADTATQKAEEAKTAAENAQTDANTAKQTATEAKTAAESAVVNAATAQNTASEAKTTAEAASNTAEAAKLDAEQAEKDIAAFAENLETYKNTVAAEYARKTDLTETTANLQTQISQNAAEIEATAQQVTVIDETANNAADLAEQAQSEAAAAQSQADKATADAAAAQTKADEAKAAATSAQTEADNAKAAAETAQSVADQAEADLKAAQADLATVTSRVDATEADITAAQEAVTAAQAAADKAKADATTAAEKAATAQNTADTAVTNAANAQTAANEAAQAANLAQQTADEAKGNAATAQAKADEAAEIAEAAQATANTAKSNADSAQAKANEAAAAAATAQQAADDAGSKARQAAADLATAQQNLADVTSRVDATEEEVAAAQAAVETAQAAADKAKQEAAAAQSTADTAKANAATAQAAADNAKTAADNAQQAANEAQAAADKAQVDVEALEVRVVNAETSITQNSEQIELRAKKTEVTQAVNDIKIGGRNLIPSSEWICDVTTTDYAWNKNTQKVYIEVGETYTLSCYYNGIRTTDQSHGYAYIYAYDSNDTKIIDGDYMTTSNGVRTRTATEANISYVTVSFGVKECVVGDVYAVKLEKGNKATDWTPAPEDVAEDISIVEDTANEAVFKITEAESVIKQLAESISMLVTDENGASLMTQTENGWTFSTASLQEAANSTAESLAELITQMGGIDSAVDALNKSVGEIEAITENVKISTYTYTDDNGTEQTEPSIDLYESDTGFRLKITNTRFVFTDGANVLVEIESAKRKLKTETIAASAVEIGGWVWQTRNGGKNLGLIWKGV